ncbi:MAG: DUF927 domain-containing protein [Ruminococcaceae bacterium]|nr:DUF927 domain-containing protein [Oscillospiraceae bacterium]
MQYQVTNRRLEVDIEDSADFVDFSENLYISQVQKDLLTGEEHVTVVIQFPNYDFSISIAREVICGRIIATLAKYGFSCVDNAQNNEVVQVVLFESEATAKKAFFHKVLGFAKDANGVEFFLHHHPVGISNAQKSLSVYVNESDIEPRGSFAEWKAGVKHLVYQRGQMELALAIGAVAPIAHILLEDKVITELPLIALIGETTSGKTTSLIVGASLWFSQALIADFNCTQNAFIAQLSQSRGLPMFVDEASAVPDWKFDNLLYNLPKGKSKLRCKSDGTLQERKVFSGCVIFTGETSLFKQASNNRGMEARLLELNLVWTEDEEHAENIAEYFSQHYGVATQPLVQWLLANKSEVKDLYIGCYNSFRQSCSSFTQDRVMKRLLKIPAMIITAANVLNKALGLQLNEQTLVDTLTNIMQEKVNASKNDPAVWYEAIKNYILSHRGKFPQNEDVAKKDSLWGFCGHYKMVNKIAWIRQDVFEALISDITNIPLSDAKKLLAEKKYILHTSSRHYIVSQKIGDCHVQCYGVFLTYPPKSLNRKEVKRTSSPLSED